MWFSREFEEFFINYMLNKCLIDFFWFNKHLICLKFMCFFTKLSYIKLNIFYPFHDAVCFSMTFFVMSNKICAMRRAICTIALIIFSLFPSFALDPWIRERFFDLHLFRTLLILLKVIRSLWTWVIKNILVFLWLLRPSLLLYGCDFSNHLPLRSFFLILEIIDFSRKYIRAILCLYQRSHCLSNNRILNLCFLRVKSPRENPIRKRFIHNIN